MYQKQGRVYQYLVCSSDSIARGTDQRSDDNDQGRNSPCGLWVGDSAWRYFFNAARPPPSRRLQCSLARPIEHIARMSVVRVLLSYRVTGDMTRRAREEDRRSPFVFLVNVQSSITPRWRAQLWLYPVEGMIYVMVMRLFLNDCSLTPSQLIKTMRNLYATSCQALSATRLWEFSQFWEFQLLCWDKI